MKKKKYVTTEFYKNPSKAMSFVKDGGIVYLGYKKMKEPIAVLTSYKDYTNTVLKTKKESKKSLSLYERFGKYAISDLTMKDSAEYFRKQRDKE